MMVDRARPPAPARAFNRARRARREPIAARPWVTDHRLPRHPTRHLMT